MQKIKNISYLLGFIAIIAKASVVGIGYPEALVTICLVLLEGYGKYLAKEEAIDRKKLDILQENVRKITENNDEISERLSSLEAKVGLSIMGRR